MQAVKLKASSQGVFVLFDMQHSPDIIEKDLIRTFEEAGQFWGQDKQVNVILENSDDEEEDMKMIENLLQSLGIAVNRSNSDPDRQVSYYNQAQDDITTEGSTLLIQKNIRSGQKVEHDGTIVVIGDVNPGAEIKAAGHVIIVGNLKGIVHAGYAGDRNAVIYANKFEPNIIKIADVIAKAPENNPDHISVPEIAKIHKNHIIIEKI